MEKQPKEPVTNPEEKRPLFPRLPRQRRMARTHRVLH